MAKLNNVAWRYVVSKSTTELLQDARQDQMVLITGCPEGGDDHQKLGPACFCVAAHWFRRALLLYPRALFIGKTEEDATLNMLNIANELLWASKATGGVLNSTAKLIWYGLFQWAIHDEQRGAYCGGDEIMATRLPDCRPFWSRANSVIAPFASGALDVRSYALVQQFSACEHVWKHLEHRRFVTACDGGMGYFMALCLQPHQTISAFHLTYDKMHPAFMPITHHSCVAHPNKQQRQIEW
eukprot:CAMPEP_0119313538 /NCGR_PEP_ID=MMETSP1333-20130426/29429_1 /TAXON_ID=418940 /ORGANISM="Scyphosphaera apsteinii, Strain RCC1455" /LENGTH=239 /DNA_ID=CAMNT_0007318395 /DNA_START=655 /DNA_END=1371 /DNA_ORIENTATION=-